MIYQDRSFEYPKLNIFVHSAGIIFCLAMIGLGLYVLVTEDFFSGGWATVLGVPFFTLLLIGLIFELSNFNRILVSDHELMALRGGRKVTIPWASIEHIYCSASQGPAAEEPFYSLYIFSKSNDFIIVRQSLKGFPDFLKILRQHWPQGELEYVPFMHLVAIFVRIYLFGKARVKLPPVR